MPTCLYIASPSFSGSTLLAMLLGGHPCVATVGEMKGGQEELLTYACSCGDLFTKCSFWAHLIAALKERGFVYDLSDRHTMPAFRMPESPIADRFMRRAYGSPAFEFLRSLVLHCWPGSMRRLEYLRRYNQTFIELVLQFNSASVFLDSSKDPIRIKYLADIPSLQLQVVHLVRDGRGVVNSARKNLGMPAHEASVEWRETHLEIERVTKRFCDGRVLRLRYEDLCTDPDGVLTSIFAFIGVVGTIKASQAIERKMHVLGNRLRLKGVLPIRLDESWRHEMSGSDLAAFASLAGSLNNKYGYGVPRGEA
ncbi:MAG: sulfotransferase [Candidatus Rokubacteria bacterium]|nr:sulfotransferase [Candidatus Rokubacteria bacterium]